MGQPVSMEKRVTLKELVAKKQVFAPCVWDCMSARAAELSGFEAILLSGCALSYSMLGMPDVGLLTSDELVAATERITNTSPLPLIIDGDDGYGDSPLMVYRTCYRLAKAGAMAITIDDSTNIRGFERLLQDNGYHSGICSREEFYAKINAALEAVKGTDCMIIARTHAIRAEGLDGCIERLVQAEKLGAPMTLIIGINNLEQCKKINEKLKGWKMYPDVGVHDGKADVDLKDIEALGFNLVTCHYLEKASLYGMLKMGKENFKNKSTVYSETFDMEGLVEDRPWCEYYAFGQYPIWLDMEAEFRDRR